MQVTPRGECNGLYVAEASRERIVVRELGHGTSNVAFDLLVHGVRSGFESRERITDNTIFLPHGDRWEGSTTTGVGAALVSNGILAIDGSVNRSVVEHVDSRNTVPSGKIPLQPQGL